MNRTDMTSLPKGTSPGFLARRSVQLAIILAVGVALGLIFNALNPDGIPLVKQRPVLHQP
ncbi:MAG: hypothetical protein R3F07_01815 [Opitutaceae bacterium]